jgi:hypothetical protein
MDPQDIVELGGRRSNPPAEAAGTGKARKFLSVHFKCCHTYGRMTPNAEGTAYEGRCPRCGAPVSARIGAGGTSQRIFEAG